MNDLKMNDSDAKSSTQQRETLESIPLNGIFVYQNKRGT